MQLSKRLVLAGMGAISQLMISPSSEARITRIVITKTESPAFGGLAFGATGQYEQLDGVAYGEVDPLAPLNAVIQDVGLAPRNGRGFVEYSMDVSILKPVEMSRGNGSLLYDVVNRGGKVITRAINIVSPGQSAAGDGFLETKGYSMVWSGWQGDLVPGGGRLTMKVPVAHNPEGSAITGRVRMEYAPTEPGSTQALGARFSSGYEPVNLNSATAIMTARVHQGDPRVTIPNDQWAFADCTKTPFPGTPNGRSVCLKAGFDTDHIYELTYDAKDPMVLGLGFAATRDLIAFLRHSDYPRQNPIAGGIRTTLLHGSSQSGRMARGLLSLGFNQDEEGRIVFDAMNPHISPARVALNIRFAQPGRDSGLHHIEHDYPGADMPVTWSPMPDPFTGEAHGLLDRCEATKTCPKIIQTVTDTEYWQRGMSLVTVDPSGHHDLEIPNNVRIYHLTGNQHGGSTPGAAPTKGICQFLSNSNSYQYNLRALLVALQDWAADGKEPPKSSYATIADQTLVAPDPATFGFPKIPGVNFAGLHNPRTIYDRGPRYSSTELSGVVTEPPLAIRNLSLFMPKIDTDGNGVDGVRSVTLQAPLGTYLGWNYRAAGYGEGDLCDNTGAFIPFAGTKAERLKSGDPRLSLEERYGTHEQYVEAVKKAADALVNQGLMLTEDVADAVAIAQRSNVLQ